ncbi:hypothetical protein ACWGQ5_28670 [Streptomyces sp. NPDC055722]
MIVYPSSPTGGWRERVDGTILGMAHSLHDLSVFLERAAIDGLTELDRMATDLIESATDLIEWRGGGPDVWMF